MGGPLPKQPTVMPFLTVIPRRYPEQKMHTSLGAAKNAFFEGRYGDLYEWKDGGWVLLYEVPQPETERAGNGYYGYRRYIETRPWKLAPAVDAGNGGGAADGTA